VLNASEFLNAIALITMEKIAKAINLGNRTASTAFVEYNKDIISKGKAINIAFAVPLSDCLACDFKLGFDMKIIAPYCAVFICKYNEAICV